MSYTILIQCKCQLAEDYIFHRSVNLRNIFITINEPRHDKTNKVTVRPAKTQISLGIPSEDSDQASFAQWVAKDPSFLHADSEDSDQTGRMPRLNWVFAGRTLILLVLSCRSSNVPQPAMSLINIKTYFHFESFIDAIQCSKPERTNDLSTKKKKKKKKEKKGM